MQYTLRAGQVEDLDALQGLFIETIKYSCYQDYTPGEIRAWISSVENKSRWIHKIQQQEFILAERNGLLAGYTSLADKDYIDFMYVHPDYQGAGLASLLLESVESKAISYGRSIISSDVSHTARPFFERKGYRVLHKNEHLVKGEILINFRVEKSLILS